MRVFTNGNETPKREAESLKERQSMFRMLLDINSEEPVDDDVLKSFLFWR